MAFGRLGLILILVAISVVTDSAWSNAEEPIEIMYFHRPPYYVQQEYGPPQGIVLNLAREIFTKAGVEHRFVPMPSKRILDTIERGGNYCSIGWLRSSNREKYAVYSKPIYLDKPLVLMMSQDKAGMFPRELPLETALKSGLSLGVISGFYYGDWADSHIKRIKPNLETINAGQKNLLTMVAMGRCDMMLIGLEEAEWVMKNYTSLAVRLAIKKLTDAPAGNLRHIIYSRQVDPKLISAIDRVIERMLLPAF